MIYGYCKATKKEQLNSDFLYKQVELISDRYYNADIKLEKNMEDDDRVVFINLITNLKSGDRVVFVTLEAIASNLGDIVETIEFLIGKSVSVHILDIGIFDNSTLGKILLKTLNSVIAFEGVNEKLLLDKNIVNKEHQNKEIKDKECQNKEYKKMNLKEGRPKKYTEKQMQEAMELLNKYSYKKVEEMTGISKSTLIRAKKQK